MCCPTCRMTTTPWNVSGHKKEVTWHTGRVTGRKHWQKDMHSSLRSILTPVPFLPCCFLPLFLCVSRTQFPSAAISAETMELHHSKHHNTYVTNLNAAIEKIDSAMTAGDVSATIALQGALKFNGGGHLNHCLFWENLSPKSGGVKSGGALEVAIAERFGSVDAMKEQMSATTIAIQGSGWGWLGYNPKTGKCGLPLVVGMHGANDPAACCIIENRMCGNSPKRFSLSLSVLDAFFHSNVVLAAFHFL
jgi:superoxide dismutase